MKKTSACRSIAGTFTLLLTAACGGDNADDGPDLEVASADDAPPADSSAADANTQEASEGDGETETLENQPASPFALFEDPDSDFATSDVYDATREVFRFDTVNPAVVLSEGGVRDSGWLTDGNQIGGGGGFGNFMIRFGTEGGERRAYFTEVEAGTVCDLRLVRPEMLVIYSTAEPPPSE